MRTTTVVVGAGHAGLAVSRCLTELSIDHVVIERGEVANTWRTERWDSLRLLTPNWQSRLPGFAYRGDDPDGFMTVDEVVRFIEDYARFVDPPLVTHTTVTSVTRSGDGYRVETDNGVWWAETVVIASGGFNIPKVPEIASALPADVMALTPIEYRGPDLLPEGGVLVVGASATGIQIAAEIHQSGRPVTLSVGEHVRMPRTYRGRDIQWWMEKTGRADERYDEVDDIVRARRVPSPQLVGSRERDIFDLNALTDMGVRLVGRLAGVAGKELQFSGSLPNKVKLADLKMGRLLDQIDEWIVERGLEDEVEPPHRFPPTRVDPDPPLSLRLDEVRTVIWATGFVPDHSWLHIPVFDWKGQLKHEGGVVTESPGLYRIGLNFLRRRKSSFIFGAEDDARDITRHLAGYLDSRVRAAG